MLRTNKDKTIMIAVSGIIKQTRTSGGFETNHNGRAFLVPSTGGITYNVRLGDSVYGLAGDHIEPAVSCFNERPDEGPSFSALCCMGNHARVLTGEGKGAVGFVFGQHGGVQHIMIDFHPDDLEKLAINDTIQIKSWGQGLTLLDYPDVTVTNIDPNVLDAMDIREHDGKLQIPVAGVIPAQLIGSGFGDVDKIMGRDCDMMTTDWNAIVENHLENLKFGDLVYIADIDSGYGRAYKRGAASIGVVIHGDSFCAGHGPGIATFLTSAKNILEPIIDPSSNIKKYHDAAYGTLVPLK